MVAWPCVAPNRASGGCTTPARKRSFARAQKRVYLGTGRTHACTRVPERHARVLTGGGNGCTGNCSFALITFGPELVRHRRAVHPDYLPNRFQRDSNTRVEDNLSPVASVFETYCFLVPSKHRNLPREISDRSPVNYKSVVRFDHMSDRGRNHSFNDCFEEIL